MPVPKLPRTAAVAAALVAAASGAAALASAGPDERAGAEVRLAAAPAGAQQMKLACASRATGLLRFVTKASACRKTGRARESLVRFEGRTVQLCVKRTVPRSKRKRQSAAYAKLPVGAARLVSSASKCGKGGRPAEQALKLPTATDTLFCAKKRTAMLRVVGATTRRCPRGDKFVFVPLDPSKNRQNAAPVAAADSATTDEDTAVAIAVLANDKDPEGDPLALGSLDTSATKGLVTPKPDGTLTYDPNGRFDDLGEGETGTDTFGYRARAAGADSALTVVTVTVTAVNDAPEITAPGAQTVDLGSALTFAPGGGNGISVADRDAGAGDERLSLSATNGLLDLATTSGLTFVAGDGAGDAAMTVEGTLAELNAALDGLAYTSALNLPDTGLTITLDDLGRSGAGGAKTDTASVPITVDTVNDPPVNQVPGAQNVAEDATLTLSTGNGNAISVSDGDAGGDPVQVALSATNGTLTLAGTAGLTFTAGDGTADASMTVQGTLGAINAAMNGMHYAPSANYNGPAQVSIATSDLGNNGPGGPQTDTDAVAVAVSPVNDGPVNTVPAARTSPEDTLLTFSSANGAAISTADVDAGAHDVQVALAVTQGRLSLATLSGLTFRAGDGQNDPTMTFEGTVAEVNAALNGLSYNPVANFFGADTLTVTTSDLGRSGEGGTLSDTDAVPITVTAVNDAPVVIADTLSEAKRAIGNTTLLVDDPSDGPPADPAGPQKTVSGDVLANDSDVDSPSLSVVQQTVSSVDGGRVDIQADGDFTYRPPVGCNGGSEDRFTYVVTDNHPTEPLTTASTVTIHIADCVWYVDDTAASGGPGDSQGPLTALGSLNGAAGAGDADAANAFIFLYDGTYTGGLTLENGQQLVSKRHGLSVPNGGGAPPVTLESAAPGGTASQVDGGVALASGNTIQGIELGSTGNAAVAALSGSSVGTATVNTQTAGGINNPAGGAVSIGGTGNVLAMAFTSVTSAGSAGSAISIANAAGTVSAPAGSLTNATGTTVALNGGNLDFTYGGTVTDDGGQLISISNQTGGLKDFNGAVSDAAAANPDGGIVLSNNGGATIRFDGGVNLSTGSGKAFSAIGGGTIAVPDPASSNNTLDSTTGGALEVVGTTIHADDLTFERLSSNGAARGIRLDSTGSSGNLVVTGNGGTCTNANPSGCSGGVIRSSVGSDDSGTNPPGSGIVLNQTRDVSLTRMRLHDHQNYAIRGNGVTNLTVANSVVNGANGGTTASSAGSPFREGSLVFNELTGAASITNSHLSGGWADNLRVANTAGTLNLTVSSTTIGENSTSQGNDGISIEGAGSAVMNPTIQGNTFTSSRGDLFQFTQPGTGNANLQFTGNTLSNNHSGISTGGGGVTLNGGGGAGSTVTMNLDNNTFRDAVGHAVLIVKDPGSGTLHSTFSNNSVGLSGIANSGSREGDGLKVQHAGTGTLNATITGNQIRQYNNNGIHLQAGAGVVAGGNLNATVSGNTVANPGNNAAISNVFQGLHLNSGTAVGDTFATCLHLGSNTLTNSGRNTGTDFRLRQRQSTTVRLPGYAGGARDTNAVVAFAQSRLVNPATGSAFAEPSTGGGFTGTGSNCNP